MIDTNDDRFVPEGLLYLYGRFPEIVKVPDSILRATSLPVLDIGPGQKATIVKMRRAVVMADGIGIAAPQIGTNERIIIVRPKVGLATVMINPELAKDQGPAGKTGTVSLEEGCLSIPGLYGMVERPYSVKVTYLNEPGRRRYGTYHGLVTAVILHEIDHLDGVLFTDRVDWSTVQWRGPQA